MAPRKDDPEMIAELQKYIDALAAEAKFAPEFTTDDRDTMLGLTGVAAHNVVRPAAPFASLAVGYLVGAGKVTDWAEGMELVKRLTRAYAGDPAPAPEHD